MSSLVIKSELGLNNSKHHFDLSLIEFQEDQVTIIYSPALDLSGYGYNLQEARNSFSEALQEFFRYTSNKKTTDKILEDLGWSIIDTKEKPRFNPPKDSDLVQTNPLFNDIVNNKDYKVSREDVELAL